MSRRVWIALGIVVLLSLPLLLSNVAIGQYEIAVGQESSRNGSWSSPYGTDDLAKFNTLYLYVPSNAALRDAVADGLRAKHYNVTVLDAAPIAGQFPLLRCEWHDTGSWWTPFIAKTHGTAQMAYASDTTLFQVADQNGSRPTLDWQTDESKGNHQARVSATLRTDAEFKGLHSLPHCRKEIVKSVSNEVVKMMEESMAASRKEHAEHLASKKGEGLPGSAVWYSDVGE